MSVQNETGTEIVGYILAGGKNSRMGGIKKVTLEYRGETFGRRISMAMEDLPEIYLSVENCQWYDSLGFPMIEDQFDGIGPIGGICSGLRECRCQALLVAACDMPFLDKQTVRKLLDGYRDNKRRSKSEENSGIVVAQTGERVHPLLGIYPKTVLPVLESQIARGNYRMMDILRTAGYTAVLLEEKTMAATNVNSTEEYRRLVAREPFMFAINGYKNTGKTTLMTKVIAELTGRGYKVAVIKHDGHDFESDVPGTDSWRHQKAGAYGTAVYSGQRFMIAKECCDMDEKKLAQAFPEADIILIEGLKNCSYPHYTCSYPQQLPIAAEELADEIERLWKER